MKEERSKAKKDLLYPGRKSIGFALPFFLLMFYAGVYEENPDWINLHQFFLHFLTARALHDDMLDYKKDKKVKHPNAVADLIKSNKKIDIKSLVNTHITQHVRKARKHLSLVKVIDKNTYLHHILEKMTID